MATVLSLGGKTPRIAPGVFLAPSATVIGDVEIGEGSSVWFGCVLRGDVGKIRIGKQSNIQDLSCLHMTDGVSDVIVGDLVTVGHGVILHGCSVGDGALIGMGSTLLDGVVIGARSLVAAGSLVTSRMVVPAGSLVRGSPARILRDATEEEREMGVRGAEHYVENARRYLGLLREER